MYISRDSGSTWTPHLQDGPWWNSIACSADARRLAAAHNNAYTGGIWLSADSGASWDEGFAPGTTIWQCLACSADGTRVVGARGGGIYICQLFQSPFLRVRRPDNISLLLEWAVPVSNFVLQQSPAAANPAWTDVPVTPNLVVSRLSYQVTVPVTEQNTFYRLVSR
jgi:hypothetical protein